MGVSRAASTARLGGWLAGVEGRTQVLHPCDSRPQVNTATVERGGNDDGEDVSCRGRRSVLSSQYSIFTCASALSSNLADSAAAAGVHADRIIGGDRHHRHSGGT